MVLVAGIGCAETKQHEGMHVMGTPRLHVLRVGVQHMTGVRDQRWS